MELISLLLLGIVAGVLAGLLGVGGGVVIVPVLIWIFAAHPEIPSSHLMHFAIATSLATIMVTSSASIIAHHRHAAVRWPIVVRLAPGIVLGALIGAVIADALTSALLKLIFAVFLLVISIHMAMGKPPAAHRQLPAQLGLTPIGMIIGMISALVGIGGGSLTVPFLVWCNVSMRHAVATSAACGLPIAVAGTLGYVVTGGQLTHSVAWSSGYVYWPAFLAISATSLLSAPLGAQLAHTLPVTLLKKFFAGFLAVVGIKLLLD